MTHNRNLASPAPARLPMLTWEDVETAVEDLAAPAMKDQAVRLTRILRQESANLSPLDILQEIILNAAATMPPYPPPEADRASGWSVVAMICGTLPRLAGASVAALSQPRRRFVRWWPPPFGSPPA